MGMNQDPRGDAYGRSPERPDAPAPAAGLPGLAGKITTRPSRPSILQSYATQDEMRARDARLRSQQASRAYTASAARARRRSRGAARGRLAQQREQEARRAAQQRPAPAATPAQRAGRAPNPRGAPALLPGELRPHSLFHGKLRACPRLPRCPFRGSPGPCAQPQGHRRPRQHRFAHLQREPPISACSRDDRDRHDPMIDTMDNRTWYSRAGQGFATPAEGAPGAPAPVRRPRSSRASDVGFVGVMSGSADSGGAQGGSGVPLFVRVASP